MWLRDNCPCGACRDARSQQKFIQMSDIPDDLAIAAVEFTNDEAAITFHPDGHRSKFSRRWLDDQVSARPSDLRGELAKVLWRGEHLASHVTAVEWSSYQFDDDVRRTALRGVVNYGFTLLRDTPTHEGTVLAIARTFGFVRETNYGQLFDVRVEVDASNLAFTSAAIAPHTDNPYRDPVPTMQLLHCVSNDVHGGQSGLVDGFMAAALLRQERPDYFEVLTNTAVRFAWGDEQHSLSAERSMIETDPRGHIRGVRFNNRSMQPLQFSAERISEYYDAYRYFARIIERPDMMWHLRLDPGDCLIFDNTRLLHARRAFEESGTGRRHLQGCYADLDGLLSTLSILDRSVQ